MKQINIDEAVKILTENKRLILLTHENPDGDTVGSAFALKSALSAIGKEVFCLGEKALHSKYSFLGNFDSFRDIPDIDDCCIVSVDVADKKLLGSETEKLFGDKVHLSVDHHAANRLFADYTFVSSSAAATCELVFDIISALRVTVDSYIANCIYTGLSTDTGCFRYSNVTSKTMRIAAEMIDCGAENAEINRKMFETKTKTYASLERLALDDLTLYCDGKLAIISVTSDMYRLSGSNETETEAIASLPRQIEGVEVGIMMREKNDGTFKVSMRGNGNVDVSVICSELGGGGHKAAAGCTVAGDAEFVKSVLLRIVKKYL